MKKMILAVMCAMKEIAIKPEKIFEARNMIYHIFSRHLYGVDSS